MTASYGLLVFQAVRPGDILIQDIQIFAVDPDLITALSGDLPDDAQSLQAAQSTSYRRSADRKRLLCFRNIEEHMALQVIVDVQYGTGGCGRSGLNEPAVTAKQVHQLVSRVERLLRGLLYAL